MPRTRVASIVALALVVAALPAAAEAKPKPTKPPKPPTRLWYRVALSFDGTMTKTSTDKRPAPPPLAAPVFRWKGPYVESWKASWRTGSEHAVGVKRRAGGKSNFFAAANGVVESFTHTKQMPPHLNKSNVNDIANCSGWTQTGELAQSLPVEGNLGRIDMSDGFGTLGVQASHPGSTLDWSDYTNTCHHEDARGNDKGTQTGHFQGQDAVCCYHPVAYPAYLNGTFTAQPELMGTEPYLGDRELVEAVPPLEIKSAKFGRRITLNRNVTHTYTAPRPYPTEVVYQWQYHYHWVLTPCPRHGRNVASC